MRQASAVNKALTPGDAYRNAILDNVSIAAMQEPGDFISRILFPTIGSTDQTGLYYRFTMGSIQQDKAQQRAPGNESEVGSVDLVKDSYLCQQWSYAEKTSLEIMKTLADAEAVSAASVAEVLMISSERRFATDYWKTGVWGTGSNDVTGVASGPTANQSIFWNPSVASSAPIDEIYKRHTQIKLLGGKRANTIVLGRNVADALLTHPTIIGRLNNGQTPNGLAMATLADLAKAFMVDRVLVADSVYNSAAEGATPVPAYCLDPKSAWMGYVNPKPNKMTTSAGYRFAWEGIAGNSEGIRNYSWWDQAKKAQMVEGIIDDTFKLVNAANGLFFSAIVQ